MKDIWKGTHVEIESHVFEGMKHKMCMKCQRCACFTSYVPLPAKNQQKLNVCDMVEMLLLLFPSTGDAVDL